MIATAHDIEDRLATEFAVAFYQALTTGQESGDRTIPAGCNIDRAFGQASGFARASSRGKLRDLVADVPVSREISDNEGFPGKSSIGRGPSTSAALAFLRRSPFRLARRPRRHRLAGRALSRPRVFPP